MSHPLFGPSGWPRTAPPPLSQAVLRAEPGDFVVEEQMPHVPEGRGEHLWLQVRKRGFNTDHVAKLLARSAGVTHREVGYAGMKDRNAVTVQWFSLYLPGRPDPSWSGLPSGIEVLAARRHTRKLKIGALAGNCFTLVLRECAGDADALAARVQEIVTHGVPNYFGEQRFGHDGDNIAHARAMLAGRESVHDRHLRGIYLSALRAYLFNEVLAARVAAGSWRSGLPGEAFMLAGSNSFFVAETIDATLQARLDARDIHPSGPLWGEGELPSRGIVHELEAAIIARYPDLAAGLAAERLRQERRALRLLPRELSAERLEPSVWRLRFCLPAGSYATMVVREMAEYRSLGGVGLAE
jgi:tRNA pseudouridine13 synthase